MTTLVARFAMTRMEETPIEAVTGSDEPWVSGLTMYKEYTAGIVGTAVLHFVYSGAGDDRGYLAAERITGALDDGSHGSFTVHHGALSDPDDDDASFGYVIPGSGTGGFAGLSGSARIRHDEEGAHLVLTFAD
jgi:hypothetical protein